MKVIQLKLIEHIRKKGISQKRFAEKCGLRAATISQMVNNKYDRIQLTHLVAVMEYLEITDFNEILEIVDITDPAKPDD